MELILIHEMENVEERQPRRHRHGQRGDPFNDLSDKLFTRLFRLSKELAMFLINLLENDLSHAHRATDLDVQTKVLVCLRFFATGSYQLDIGCNYNFNIAQSSVSRCIEEVVNAINREEIFNNFVKFPRNVQELNAVRSGFFQKYNFPGIIGCIDCTHVAIFPPKINDDHYPEHIYVNRKNYHSINVQLVCDQNLKIMNVNALFPGSTNDAFIWNQSNLQITLRTLHEGGNKNYFLLGDSGYPLRTWLLTPIEQEPEPNTPAHFYNYRHRTIRSSIERCYGVLKTRFRCLLKHRVLHYSPEKATKIINACVVLHNLCIDYKIPVPQDEEEGPQDFGIYEPANLPANLNRVNPELAEGKRQRDRIIRALQQ